MRDISLHLSDIIENSAKAGAHNVVLSFQWNGDELEIRISDDGPGLPESIRKNPTDPYATTRKERKVGLGLPLLKEAAEQTGGGLKVSCPNAGGVLLEALFNFSHIDCKPLGDIENAIMSSICAWPSLDFKVFCGDSSEPAFDTTLIKKELDSVPINHPSVAKFLSGMLQEALTPLKDWCGSRQIRKFA